MARLKWRVKLVAERHPGVVTETELACIERDEAVGLADLGLRLDEAKRLAAALQVEIACCMDLERGRSRHGAVLWRYRVG